ncbi:hypothetical protein ACFC1I_08235 [Microbacterium sp. NPDC056044]|uniref:hypothetical protein n=1 Tax=Microbacterium sp. NPDC056044 TaxID=3345690 RepID=UPI0035D5F511
MNRYLASAVAIVTLFAVAGCAPPGATSSTPEPSPSGSTVGYEVGSELDPGTYTSQVFDTPVTFTVPAGWKVFEDVPGWIGLARMENDGPPLLVVRDVDAAAKSCSEEAEPGVGRTPAQLTTWLSEHEGLATSEPSQVTVGGLDGTTIDTAMAPSWTTACPFSEGQPIAMTLVGTDISKTFHWGNDAEWSDRLWVLDLPSVENGNIVIVGTICCGVDRQDQLDAVQEVVDSFEFDTGET